MEKEKKEKEKEMVVVFEGTENMVIIVTYEINLRLELKGQFQV